MHQYWGFGLYITSEIEFPELYPFPFSEVPDITIQYGNTPKELRGEPTLKRVDMLVAPTEYLLKVNGIASYYASNGNRIIVQPAAGADISSVRLFLLSNAITAILYQRNTIPLHASAVVYNEKLILFCGHSRAGKSTLATKLNALGYPIFSDDICVLKISNDDKLVIYPSYPMSKLWEDSFDLLSVQRSELNVQLRPHLAKYGNYFHGSFDMLSRDIFCTFILNDSHPATKEDVEIRKISSMEASLALFKMPYRQLQLDGMLKRAVNFSTLSKLSTTSSVYEIRRDQNLNTINLLAEKVIELIHFK
ncbi:hypothetical protein [Sediminibacterium ginsengisoli]|uniref:Hpr(Ser) kinase/phosphatase n=1 Tax=Sediminibacterium ginsengisoli TaxID=413434 RepID=A0A1T4L6K6_9BACT|nr:hypothetical protein [Sediminibacterium ginsengisoli]SJZ50243.1 hypothetical protein SAMN04488132_102326 [Sediminibacterium ginsengisoli]